MKKIALLIITLIPQFIVAQIADTLDMGEIVVTSSKIPVLEKATTKPVTIIDARTIRNSAGKSLSELLNSQNGIIINGANSSPGKDKSVYIRGASTQYTLILLDGFPVNDPSSEGGAFDLRLIPLASVERIEIVKGSMSTLYGSDAIAGVINIITKKPADNLLNINGQGSYGSFKSSEMMVGANGYHKRIGYSVDISRYQTAGFSEAKAQGTESFARDGYIRNSILAKVNVNVSRDLEIIPFLNFSDYDGDYDAGPFMDADNQFTASLLNAGSRFQYTLKDVDIKGAYTFNHTERKFLDAFGVFNPKSDVHNADVFAVYKPTANFQFLAGFNYQSLNFDLEDNGVAEGSGISSPYLTAYLKSGFGLNAELGIRMNNHSEYGTNWSYNIAPVYQISDEIRLLMSLSSGFKAPTLNELYGPFGANIDLDPQISNTFNVGFEYQNSLGFNTTINYFRRRISNLIQFVSAFYVNANEQNDSGVEITSAYTFGNSEISAFYNYLTGAITIDGEEQNNLIRRPNHSFGFNWRQQITASFLSTLSGSFIGERKDLYFDSVTFANEETELDSYFLVNLYLQYSFNNSITVFGNVNNVLNTDYTEIYGFNTAGINFNGGLRFSI